MKKLVDGLLYVLLFGPGFGESVVVRVPPDSWIVVDGCTNNGSMPAAELAEQGASWSAVVFTHPHADHAAGLDAVLEMDGEGPIGCADLAPVRSLAHAGSKARLLPKVAEHVLAAIQDRWDADPDARWILTRGSRRTIGEADLEVLHPTPNALARYPDPDPDPNRISSAVRLTWKGVTLLLGADVLADGWADVSTACAGLGDHSALKAPHHLSIGAHHPCYGTGARGRLWLATPFNKHARGLPRFEDGQGVSVFLGDVDRLLLTGMPVAAKDQAAHHREVSRSQVRDGALDAIRVLTSSVSVKLLREPAADSRANEANWLMAGFDGRGVLADLQRGPGSLTVTP